MLCFICYLAASQPVFTHYWRDSLTHPILLTVLSIFDTKIHKNFLISLGSWAWLKLQWDSNKKSFYSALGYSRKNPNRGKTPDKMNLHPWKFYKIMLYPLEFPRPETKIFGNFTRFFLDHPWKFHFFFIDPWKFHILFFQYLWKFYVLNRPVRIFSGIAHY